MICECWEMEFEMSHRSKASFRKPAPNPGPINSSGDFAGGSNGSLHTDT